MHSYLLYCPIVDKALAKIPFEELPGHVEDQNHRYYGHPLFFLGQHGTRVLIGDKQNTSWVKSHQMMLSYDLVDPKDYSHESESV